MQRNMSKADQLIRGVIAATIAGLYFANLLTGTLGLILIVFAGVFLVTSYISFCPLYALFGIQSCKHHHHTGT